MSYRRNRMCKTSWKDENPFSLIMNYFVSVARRIGAWSNFIEELWYLPRIYICTVVRLSRTSELEDHPFNQAHYIHHQCWCQQTIIIEFNMYMTLNKNLVNNMKNENNISTSSHKIVTHRNFNHRLIKYITTASQVTQSYKINKLVIWKDCGLPIRSAVTARTRDSCPGHVPMIWLQQDRLIKHYHMFLSDIVAEYFKHVYLLV